MLLEEGGGNYSASNSCSDKAPLVCAAFRSAYGGAERAQRGTCLSSPVCDGVFPGGNGLYWEMGNPVSQMV